MKFDYEDILILKELINDNFLPKKRSIIFSNVNKIIFKIQSINHKEDYYFKKLQKLKDSKILEEIKGRPILYLINKNIQENVKLLVESYIEINKILCESKISSGYNELDNIIKLGGIKK